jgi:hypothetical protein
MAQLSAAQISAGLLLDLSRRPFQLRKNAYLPHLLTADNIHG